MASDTQYRQQKFKGRILMVFLPVRLGLAKSPIIEAMVALEIFVLQKQ